MKKIDDPEFDGECYRLEFPCRAEMLADIYDRVEKYDNMEIRKRADSGPIELWVEAPFSKPYLFYKGDVAVAYMKLRDADWSRAESRSLISHVYADTYEESKLNY